MKLDSQLISPSKSSFCNLIEFSMIKTTQIFQYLSHLSLKLTNHLHKILFIEHFPTIPKKTFTPISMKHLVFYFIKFSMMIIQYSIALAPSNLYITKPPQSTPTCQRLLNNTKKLVGAPHDKQTTSFNFSDNVSSKLV